MDAPQEPRWLDAEESQAWRALANTLVMSELAMGAGSSLPRLSQVVARLEQRGWVSRTPDPADGRYTLATLTAQGQAKVTQAAPGHVREVRRLVLDPLTKTQSRQLREINRRITRAIDFAGQAGGGPHDVVAGQPRSRHRRAP